MEGITLMEVTGIGLDLPVHQHFSRFLICYRKKFCDTWYLEIALVSASCYYYLPHIFDIVCNCRALNQFLPAVTNHTLEWRVKLAPLGVLWQVETCLYTRFSQRELEVPSNFSFPASNQRHESCPVLRNAHSIRD